ncbi:protein patched [Anthonomus grandis grandis]|uniref:protein patched n=1 Tax=Anthonomus grandis grandis TaxID=2921223 RepID=UPI002165E37D|nr:protein patched [Anthonomus grandis grandis]XP_050314837.1 protein patched [Anthonomus grandis grandis]
MAAGVEAPDAHAPGPAESRHESDLYTRPGWVDADVALAQLNQEKAVGDRGVLWIRSRIQRLLKSLGKTLETHAGKFLFVSILAIATFSVGLKSMAFHTDIELLWAEPSTTPESSPKEMLSTHQMVVQTAVDPDVDLLNSHSLLEHLLLVQKATQVSINMFEITWRLKDFCQAPSIPNIDTQYIAQIFENIMPCSIITPLDCFWEGSKLLEPHYPVHIPYRGADQIKWTNLNPKALVEQMQSSESNFDYHSLNDYLKRAGITSGYQEKPCLNPKDPQCPTTAPNFNSSQPVDIGAELTSGCYGFAAKYMHWYEELIVGGVKKNKTGHIKEAKALQTVVQLMGEHELYEFWFGHYKVHHIGWNEERAAMVLNAWQKKFAQEIDRLTKAKKSSSSSYSFITFSTANVNRILKEYSKTEFVKYGVVIGVLAIYGWAVQSALAFIGTLVLASTAAAALGVCSLIGLPTNLLSTHVLPFVMVGLAMREMFLMLSTHTKDLTPPEILLRTGPSVVSAMLINSAAILTTALLPVPALRVFALQCAVMLIFHGAALLIVFPCLLALEQRCRKSDMPCFRRENKGKTATIQNNNNNAEHGTNLLTAEMICQQKKSIISYFTTRFFQSILIKPFVKVLMCLLYTILVVFCVFNALNIQVDVRLSSFLPRNTQEYKYLEANDKYFGFYNFYLATTELEYPFIQPLLYEYHSSLTHVPHVLKDSNGGLSMNNFWLENFRDYLEDLQQEFDNSRASYCLNSQKWFPNATEKAVLAFKLMAQTGIVEFPVDKSQILRKRLVHDGIIDPKAFYNYLSVWNSNDRISYSSSQANFTPKPFQYESSKAECDLKIPRSQPLTYTQMPFYLKGLRSTGDIIATLKQIKSISEEYNNRGLKNYPLGLIFAYFNQFLLLDRLIAIQLLLTLIAAALVACLLVRWNKLWCSLFSTMGAMLPLCLININAFSSTMGALHFIIISRNILLLTTGFLSAVGSRERRVKMSLEVNADAILKGDIGLLLAILVLALSEFEFIHNQLFVFLIISIITSFINSFIFFPLMLVIMGPKSEVIPLEHTDRISTPPPPLPAPSTDKPKVFSKASRRNPSNKATRETSLTTITEESCNQSIIVEPQITVECSSPESSGSSGPYTTKVTATANIKVEVVTPVYRSSKCSSKCHRNSKCSGSARTKPKPVPTHHQQQCKCCNKDSDSSDSTAETEPCQSS